MKTHLFLLMLVSLTACNNSIKDSKNVAVDTMMIQGQSRQNKPNKTSCLEVVTEILTTSPIYHKKTNGLYEAVVKNGGTSFGLTLEGSPDPKKDEAQVYSKTYDFSLYESYPDRNTVVARFVFNPTTRLLYEYDAVEDKLNAVEFDRDLLTELDSCTNR